MLAVLVLGCAALAAPRQRSAAESLEGGNSFNELSEKANQETTPTETTATKTTETETESRNSNKTILIAVGAAIVLLLGDRRS